MPALEAPALEASSEEKSTELGLECPPSYTTRGDPAVQLTPSSALQLEPIVRVARLPFRDLYEQHCSFTWRTLRYLGVPEPQLDDAVQEVWLVVHRRYVEFEGRSQVKSWLFSIAMNIERNLRRMRRRAGQHVPLPDDLPSTIADPARQRERTEAWLLVRGFADTLDDTRRAVFSAALLEGLSAAETAEATGLDVTTVQHRVRALRRSFERWVESRESAP